ncbi:hypothetical protein DFH08DRAFT_820873 [Mycena albidolilacea]|uniref:Uncharacterized protein n=1 Tax=Mycena albidolilacea TaxID=1033008 RepID=A0AAD7EDM6_9AGAR|nr:hypothetical protein DFH08DRAFT_820873 [Mycena albidolilacea]
MRRARTASYTYGPPINLGDEQADKTEAVAGRNVNRDPINRSAAFDVAHKEGIAPPTAALDAARRSGVWYTHGPPIDSGGERAVKTEAVACRDVDRPSSNRSVALGVARKGGIAPPTAALDAARKGDIAPPTAALDAARKNSILYIWTSN